VKRIVFICTGNTCRSPMAHAIFTRLLDSSGIETGEYEILSAGLSTIKGLPASPEAVETMAGTGIDLSLHQSRQVDDNLILTADYVLTMTTIQRDYLQDKYPDKISSIYTIAEFAGESNIDIVDPFNQGLEAYHTCARQLEQLLSRVADKLLGVGNIGTEEKAKVIAIGSDHAGFELKSKIIKVLQSDQYKILDCGTFSSQSVDYPDIAEEVAKTVLEHRIKGIIICGTGIGISIAANKIPGIRAALCYNRESASLARKHNNANIVAVGARMLEQQLVVDIIKTFLTTEFEAGRHQRRVEKISALEKKCFGRS
jgi:RpiB/LacA/LacB family sugar-phosphate isomerase